MATTALRLARSRDTTVLGRVAAWARQVAPGVGRWFSRTGTRIRRLVLHVGGLGSISWAGWEVARPLGLVLVGVSLLLLDYLSAPDSDTGR